MNFHRAALCAVFFSLLATETVWAAPMSLNAVDADVRHVLMSAARLGGFNVVLDDSIKGTVSLNMKNAEPKDVLDFVAKAKGFVVEERAGTFIIAAKKNGGAMKEMYSYKLHYANPGNAAELIGSSLGIAGGATTDENDSAENKVATARPSARVAIDNATNTVFLYGTPDDARLAEAIIKKIDVPARQVSLEAKVLAVEKNAAKELGIEWSWSSLPQYPDHDTTYDSRYRTMENADGSYTTVREDVPRTEVTRHYQNGTIPGIVQFGRGPEGYPFEFYYEAKINALVTNGKAKMLARPNITTIQGQEAVINIGGEIPVPKTVATNTSATSSIDYKKVGIILKCTPQVNENGEITAAVHTEVSSPVYVDDMKAYRIQNRAADTTVRLADGETMVIGGLIGSEESRSLSKIPFLGDLPILGVFFRNLKTSKSDSEIMIFLTAHVI